MSSKKAFTLIELLVVISIIALLLTIIIPGLQKAKVMAQSIMCRANLNGLIKCWLLYADDKNGFLVGGSTYSQGNSDWVMPPTGDAGRDPGLKMKYEEGGMRLGPFFSYTDNNIKIFHCPADRGMKIFGGNGGGYRTYSITTYMRGEGYDYNPSNPANADYAVQVKDIISPADKYVMLENVDDRGYNMGSWMMNATISSPSWIDPLAVWHNNRSTFAFADGHAEIHKWYDESTIEMSWPQPPDQRASFMYPIRAGESRRDVEWMAKGYYPKKRRH